MHKSTLSRLEAPSSRLASAAGAISSRGRKASIILPAFPPVNRVVLVLAQRRRVMPRDGDYRVPVDS